VKRVVTARRFIDLGKFEGLVAELQETAEIIYLEDIRENLGIADKAAAAIGQHMPWLVSAQSPHHAPAVILFTSGTEGEAKGVSLSHFNLQAKAAWRNCIDGCAKVRSAKGSREYSSYQQVRYQHLCQPACSCARRRRCQRRCWHIDDDLAGAGHRAVARSIS
jgi:acyl-CoA synthetase (AMP-forming)/AMP-acid ligase II